MILKEKESLKFHFLLPYKKKPWFNFNFSTKRIPLRFPFHLNLICLSKHVRTNGFPKGSFSLLLVSCRITKYVEEVYWLHEYKIAFFIFLLKFLFVIPRYASLCAHYVSFSIASGEVIDLNHIHKHTHTHTWGWFVVVSKSHKEKEMTDILDACDFNRIALKYYHEVRRAKLERSH